ncbi:AMP-binding protein [Halalkalibacterium halodurans]|uniref:AMP-binding protein n=1 Tax=Halalkalibacterium halodurans TaxID=86665 RepID=UPI002AA9FC4D|nr:AMP-binding protein [Halalkalibacterium halodurans]MDY7223643.1 AMP-binding protein [Halalkalibacterium halodurans]MDY7242864.1 AMP-binding protein [Halalkalibacterium halodurans]
MVDVENREWFNAYPKEVPHTIDYPNQTLHDLIKEAATTYPHHVALHFLGKTMTYQLFYEQVQRFAANLQQLGLQKGERVSIMLPNCPQAVIAYYGVLVAGGVVVQTNPLYVERELNHQLIDSGARFIVCLDVLYPRVIKSREGAPLEHIIVTAIKDYLPFPKNMIYPFIQKPKPKGKIGYGSHVHRFVPMAQSGSTNPTSVPIDPKEDLALLQYTGGTTGVAKGVMLTHYNLVANTIQCRKWMYKWRDGQERTLAVLPFFHVYGMTTSMNLTLMTGSELHIVPRFDPLQVLKMIDKKKITMFPGAPTMYIALINHPDLKKYDLSSIEACISGSSSLPAEVQQTFEQLTGGRLVEGYGLTEASPVTNCNLVWGERKDQSIGVPWPDTDVHIRSLETGESLPSGEIGEVVVRGPQVMKGYWNRPEETNATLQNGWLYTGDMGYKDEEGYFYIVDRKKDMIIAGGFNIYPREVEEVLYAHAKVQEAVVIGVPDEYRGETVKAFIVVKEGESVSEKELNDYCRTHLAAYKVPRKYEFRDDLPKTMVGKVLKRVLIEEETKKQGIKQSS